MTNPDDQSEKAASIQTCAHSEQWLELRELWREEALRQMAERDEARAALARVEALCDEADEEARETNPYWVGFLLTPRIRAAIRAALPPAAQQDGDG